MNADKKSTELADSKSSSANNNSNAETKGKNKTAKPEKEVSDDEEQEEENGSGDAAKKDTKNGANKKNEGPMALGEIAFIDSKITSTKIDGLQPLYNICFDMAGKAQTLKKNLRTFKGFAFKEDSSDYTKKVEAVQKLDGKVLKAICDILDVEKKGTNNEIAARICQFLLSPEGEPEPSEDEEAEDEEEDEEEEESEEEKPKKKGPPAKRGAGGTAGRPRRSTAGRNFNHDDYLSSEESEEEDTKPQGKRKRGDTDSGSDYNPSMASDSDGGRKKRAAGTRRSARYQSNSEEEDDDFVSSEEESDAPKKTKRGAPARRSAPVARGRRKKESDSEESEPEEDSDDSDAPKKKKAPVAKKGKAAAASPAKGRGRPKRVAATKKKARDQTTSEEDEEEEVDEELSHLQDKDEQSEDEPLAKKPKTGATFPTDDDIKGYVKKILDEANLEEITMKTVCKEVYAQFPGHDLTPKKDFIKATVKSLIAT